MNHSPGRLGLYPRYALGMAVKDVQSNSKSMGYEKEIIKVITVELDEVKRQYEDEKQQKESLQTKLDSVLSVQDNASLHLLRANEINDKLRHDNVQKTEQLAQIQKDFGVMEDRMKQLELRASEVDQAEIGLETTKKALEQCQQELRDQERRFRIQNTELRGTLKKLAKSDERNQSSTAKITDLNQQVIHELQRNDVMEKEIEGVPVLKEELHNLRTQLSVKNEEISSITSLLSAARRSVGDLSETLKNRTNNEHETIELRRELQIQKQEVETVKQMMAAKDALIFNKSQALELAADVIKTLKGRRQDVEHNKVQHLLDRCSQLLSDVTDSPSSSTTAGSANTSIITIPTMKDPDIFTTKPPPHKRQLPQHPTIQRHQGVQHKGRILHELLQKSDNPIRKLSNNSAPGYSLEITSNGNSKESQYLTRYKSKTPSKIRPKSAFEIKNTDQNDTPRGIYKSRQMLKPTLRNSLETLNDMNSKRVNSAQNSTKEAEYLARFKSNSPSKIRPKSAFAGNRVAPIEAQTTNITRCSSPTNTDDVDYLAAQIVIERIPDLNEFAQESTLGLTADGIYMRLLRLGDRVKVKLDPGTPMFVTRGIGRINQRYGKQPEHSCQKTSRGIVKYVGHHHDFAGGGVCIGLNLDNTDDQSQASPTVHNANMVGQLISISNTLALFDVQSSRYILMATLKEQFYKMSRLTNCT